jgi:bifunctional non-homologous end joining protein LigD
VVGGAIAPKGKRGGFGELLLGQYRDGRLVYSGRAGSGFSERQLSEVRATLEAIRVESSSCVEPVPQELGLTWVEPSLVCEVEYTEWTEEGLLRQPVFLRFRDDKAPEECVGSGDNEIAAGQRGSGAEESASPRVQRGTYSEVLSGWCRHPEHADKIPRVARDEVANTLIS